MNVLDIINTAIAEHRTRFAFELLPPLKGDGMGGVFAAIDRLIGFDPAYINVTWCAAVPARWASRPPFRRSTASKSCRT